MFDTETMLFTLSALLQGLCAIYGLVLVFYIYFRGGVEEQCRGLNEKRDVLLGEIETLRGKKEKVKGSDEEEERLDSLKQKVGELAGVYNQGQKLRIGEWTVIPSIKKYSYFFAFVVVSDVLGLLFVENELIDLIFVKVDVLYLFASVVILSLAAIAGLAGFLGYHYFNKTMEKTGARELVHRKETARGFFEKDFEQHLLGEFKGIDWEDVYVKSSKAYDKFNTAYLKKEERIDGRMAKARMRRAKTK